MASLSDIITKYRAYYVALTAETAAYTNSATPAGFLSYFNLTNGTSYTGRPVVSSEVAIDVYNTQKAAQDKWDIAFAKAQTDYTAAVHARRLVELDLISILPVNQWIDVIDDASATPAFTEAWIGTRVIPGPAPAGYQMLRAISPTGTIPHTTVFTDINISYLSTLFTAYLSAVSAVATAQTNVNTMYHADGTTPPNPRPVYPPLLSPLYINADSDFNSTTTGIALAQKLWDAQLANYNYVLTYALIDQRNCELAVLLNMPANIWIHLSGSVPTYYIGYKYSDAAPSLSIVHPGPPSGVFPTP